MSESLSLMRRLLVDACVRPSVVAVHYFNGPRVVCVMRGRPVKVEALGVRVDTQSGERSASYIAFEHVFRVDDAEGKPLLVVEGFNANGEAQP